MEFTNLSSCGSNNNGVKLLDAATEGRADDAVELLAQDPTLILTSDAMGDTAFHIAARAGHGSTVLKMMEFLKLGHIELLEEVLCEGNAHGDRPLHLALKNGHKDIAFDLALAKNSTIYMMNVDRKNAFHLAEAAGIHLSCKHVRSDDEMSLLKRVLIWFTNLWKNGEHEDTTVRSVPVVYKDGHFIFVMRLALAEHSATFEKMEQVSMDGMAPVDIQMKVAISNENDGNNDDDEEEFIKLYKAAETSKEDVVKEIMEHNPNTLELKDSMGRTALHAAARSGNIRPLKKMVEFLQNNSNLKKLLLEGDNNDSIPLHLALRNGHEKVARYLVEVAPRAVYKEDKWGASPLKLAIDKGYSDLVCYMTRADLSESIRDRLLEHANKIGIGHYALKERNLAIFQAILEGLPDLINIPDRKGWKLLSYAASKGYFDEVSYILKRFPDSPRKADEDKSFPIHKAVAGGHINVVKEFLLHCPQALQDIDRKGRNLVEIATLYKKNDVLSYLKEINK